MILVSLVSCTDNKSTLLGKWEYSNSKSELNLKNDSVFQPLDSTVLIFNENINSFEFINNEEVIFPGGLAKYVTYDQTLSFTFAGEKVLVKYEIIGDSLILSKTLITPEDNAILHNDEISNDSLLVNELKTKNYFIKKEQ